MDTQRFNELCAKYSGLGNLNTQMAALRNAFLQAGFNKAGTDKAERFLNYLDNYLFSVDQQIQNSGLSAVGKEKVSQLLLNQINHTNEIFSKSLVVTGTEAYAYDSNILYIPSGTKLVGNCNYAFYNDAGIIYIGSIDTSEATSLQAVFYGILHQSQPITLDLSNCNSIYNSYLNFDEVNLVNVNGNSANKTNRITTYYVAFSGGENSDTKKVTGLDFSYVIENRAVFNYSKIEEIWLAKGSKVRHAAAYGYGSNTNPHDTTLAYPLTTISGKSAWMACSHAYDYTDAANQTDAQGRPLELTKAANVPYEYNFSSDVKARLETFIDNDEKEYDDDEVGSRTKLLQFLDSKGIDYSTLSTPAALINAYMVAKGWTY